MKQQSSNIENPLQNNIANPGPLGLCAFGVTTILLNIHNAGYFGMNSMIIAIGIFYGGIAQVIAGIIESKKNNTFGLTAFVSYGFFWLSLVALIIIPKLGWVAAASEQAIASYLCVWGIFTLLLFFGTLRMNRGLQFVFGSLALLFFLLAAGAFTGITLITHLAGYEGIICGLSAVYTGVAEVLNEIYGKEVMPIGKQEK